MKRHNFLAVTAFFITVFGLRLSVSAIYAEENKTKDNTLAANQTVEQKTTGAKPPANPNFDNIFAGEFLGWGIKIPANNYNFVKGAVLIFGNKWGAPVNNDEELEIQVWEQLLLSFEAFRRGIMVEPKELEDQITKVLEGSKINFNWKQNRNGYTMWVRDNLREPVDAFENQLRHLIQLDKLRSQVLDSIKPEVSEDEILRDFRNEYNTIGLELVQFKDLKSAQDFYDKIKDPGLWEKKAKEEPEFSKRLGFVAFEFLMDMWKIPSEDLYKMLKLEINAIYPPTPIYKGYGVFRILEKRIADENEFAKVRDGYYKKAQNLKKYEGLNAWIQKLKEEAKIRPVWQVS